MATAKVTVVATCKFVYRTLGSSAPGSSKLLIVPFCIISCVLYWVTTLPVIRQTMAKVPGKKLNEKIDRYLDENLFTH